jgi:LPXTG-motif cell wall-anchored protein
VTTLVVDKVDFETGEKLAGATFQLYDDHGSVGSLDPADTTHGAPQTSDAEGEVSWTELLEGDYLVVETAAPEGYSLPAHPVMAVHVGADGGTLYRTFKDPADGEIAISKAQYERAADGSWTPSDGVVEFGDEVRYVMPVTATGKKVFHDVVVTDYVPGHDPDDTTTTLDATYVDGSAACATITCTVDVDEATGLITWTISGTLRDQSGSVEFTVRFAPLPDHPSPVVDGVYTASMRNVATLAWAEVDPSQEPGEGGPVLVDHSVRSNEVVVHADAEIEGEEGGRPKPHPQSHPKPRPPAVLGEELPNTGAPAGSGVLGLAGVLTVTLGAVLVLADRRRRRTA